MTFQALDGRERQFVDLMDNNLNVIEPLYTKESPWLQFFGHSNLLCTYAIKAITNYAPISKYRLRFFLREEFKCPYGNYPFKSKRHIFYDCIRFNRY